MTTLTLTTWNVLAPEYLRLQYYPHLEAAPNADLRVVHCLAVTAALAQRSDIVVLQEVNGDLAHRVGWLLREGWQTKWSQRGGDRPDGTLVAVRDRYTPTFAVGHTAVGDNTWVVATLDTPAGPIEVAGTHLSWSDLPEEEHPGVAQARVIHDELGPNAVLCGDLNDGATGVVLRAFTARGWTTNPDAGPTAVVNGTDEVAIDWVLGRGAVRPMAAQVLEEADRPLPDETFPSDHVPLQVTFHVGAAV